MSDDLIQEPDFIIDPSLQAYLPKATALEDELLEGQLVDGRGPDEPLVVWDQENILIDGHRRYRICKMMSLPYEIERRRFNDREEVELYILSKQMCRRNLPDHDVMVLTGRLHKMELKSKPRTAAVLAVAEATGQSRRTVYRQLESNEAFESLPGDWQTAIAEKIVRCPQKYYAKVAELGDDEKAELLEQLIAEDSHQPLVDRFPEPPPRPRLRKKAAESSVTVAQTTQAVTPDPIEEQPEELVSETMAEDFRAPASVVVKLLDESDKHLGLAAKAFDKLFGDEGLNAGSSINKRRVDGFVRQIALILGEVREQL